VAQDTGSAIIGPARADIYFGAGNEAGRIAGRLKNNIRFTILVPKSLDPTVGVARVPVPESRPSQVIAKLYPQTLPAETKAADKPAADSASATKTADTSSEKPAVPLPQARPIEAPAQAASPAAAQKKKVP
jgi:membrane-bound lytic murein transglycosylase A